MGLKTYEVTVDFSGYSRGYEVIEVEAESEEAAEEAAEDNWYDGREILHKIVRDDREHEFRSIKLIEENTNGS